MVRFILDYTQFYLPVLAQDSPNGMTRVLMRGIGKWVPTSVITDAVWPTTPFTGDMPECGCNPIA